VLPRRCRGRSSDPLAPSLAPKVLDHDELGHGHGDLGNAKPQVIGD
jgi:hypothetical protein